jgi:hypothetical protein
LTPDTGFLQLVPGVGLPDWMSQAKSIQLFLYCNIADNAPPVAIHTALN